MQQQAERFGRVLIFGAPGQLGSELLAQFREYEPTGFDHAGCDITDAGAVERVFERHRPTLVINTAAYHQVEACESNVATAFEVNALAVDALARRCAEVGVVFAHVSTDFVFDGTKGTPYDESDAARPLNVYATSKFAGEQLLQRHGGRWFIFRTSGLFGRSGRSSKGPTFIERMLRAAEDGETPRVVDDIVFSPSYAPHVAVLMRDVMATEKFGLYHVTNAGQCSWYEFAVEAVRASGLEPRIEPIHYRPEAGKALRPRNSALAHGALIRNRFPEMPDWREGVRAYVAQRTPRS